MGKSLYIAEKPSVAQEFAKALKMKTRRQDGYLESEDAVVTWCVGHLVTMSYPEAYDPALKRWNLETLPFIPQEFQYEVIPAVAKQFKIVAGFQTGRTWIPFMCAPTPDGKESIFTDWWNNRQVSMARSEEGCGSILRQRKRFFEGFVKQKI